MKTNQFKRPSDRNLKFFAVLGLVLIATTIFSYTVVIRRPWFGVYSGENHDWLTASSVIFTDNWSREGAWNLRFGMYENPKSPEISTQISRQPYLSYPPGAVLPVFMIGEAIGHEPTVGMVMTYDLANHLLVTIFLALTVFFFLNSLKIRLAAAFLFSLIPILLELLLPSPFYYFQNSFFSDQAVILPFVLVVFLEVIRADLTGRRRKVIDLLQGLVFFYGVFTDWLFVFVSVVFFIKRLLSGEISVRDRRDFFSGTLRFAAGPVSGLALFIVHITVFMWGDLGYAVEYIRHKYFVRAGLDAGDNKTGGQYYQQILQYVDQGYGFSGRIILFITVLFVLVTGVYLLERRLSKNGASMEARKIVQLAFIVVAPCILQIFFFMNHSAVHSFSVLKLSLPISMVPFVLIPLFMVVLARDLIRKVDLSRAALFIALPALLLTCLYLARVHDGYKEYFAKKNTYWYQIADATNRYAAASDVVLSPDLYIPDHPPQPLSLTMKRVYKIESAGEIAEMIQKTGGGYRVAVIFSKKPVSGSYWDKAVSTADSTAQNSNFCAYFSSGSLRKLQGM